MLLCPVVLNFSMSFSFLGTIQRQLLDRSMWRNQWLYFIFQNISTYALMYMFLCFLDYARWTCVVRPLRYAFLLDLFQLGLMRWVASSYSQQRKHTISVSIVYYVRLWYCSCHRPHVAVALSIDLPACLWVCNVLWHLASLVSFFRLSWNDFDETELCKKCNSFKIISSELELYLIDLM